MVLLEIFKICFTKSFSFLDSFGHMHWAKINFWPVFVNHLTASNILCEEPLVVPLFFKSVSLFLIAQVTYVVTYEDLFLALISTKWCQTKQEKRTK